MSKRTKYSVLVILLLINSISICSFAGNPSTFRSLNDKWQFALAKTEAEAAKLTNFYQPQFDEKGFQAIPVPSNWAVLGFEEPVYRGFKDDKASEGFYRYSFKVTKDWQKKRVLLHFGGVWSEAEVWLNGVSMGRHNGGFSSFAFDISGRLKETNTLAVRVRQVCTDYKLDVYDDWTLGGIYRDVTLEAMPAERWLDKVSVQTVFDDKFNDADLKVRVMVSDLHKSKLPGNYPLPGEPYDLRLTLSDKNGNTVAQEQQTIPGHTATDREIPFSIRIKAPHQWTAETPYLYNLKVELLEKSGVTHTLSQAVGFRQISTTGGVFRINGQAVKLRGVNRHDEHPDVGRATTREHWLQDLLLMKAANINYIRMCHYAPAKGFVELCDSLGMYVGEEISIGGAESLIYDPSLSGAVLQRSYETVARDLNSPSVVYWSVGNEDPLTAFHLAAIKLIKGLDSTRPVLIPWRAEEWLPEEIDILAPHYWKPQEYDQLAGRSTRPIISTEYTHAYGNNGMGGLNACWKALTKYPAGTGAAVWMWADQGLKTPNPKEKNDLSPDKNLRLISDGWDGIVDSYRNPTRDYWEVKAVYAQVYPAIDKVTFTPGQSFVNIPIQNDYDFTNLSSVTMKWIIRADDKELASGRSSFNCEPHSQAMFQLPLDALKTIKADKTHYAWFIFTNSSREEITRKAVELEPLVKKDTVPVAGKIKLIKTEMLTVSANKTDYVFNPKTGQLVAANRNNKPLITDLSPLIWRNTDKCESFIPGGRQVRDAKNMTKFSPTVENWTVEELANKVLINARVKYTIDDKNSFVTTYRYTISADGTLDVHYEILTKVAIPWLPVVGMVVKSNPELNKIKWLGLGPYDAYPNKKAALILGVWGGAAGSPDVTGTKSVRWIERSGSNFGFRIAGNAYMEHTAEHPETIYVLSGVLGRPEKSRTADESIPQLLTNTDKPFVGEFRISLK
ncbi:MAG: glycoside hydrolase family 2 TIM barrel-domain containing protein [Paludibacter sp.]